jgi:hypothetical protein
MIKGVNKQILEVVNTESPYFEKIIFFVRPESQQLDEKKLHSEAVKISKTAQRPPKQRRSKKQILSTILYSLLGTGAGLTLAFLLDKFIV